LREIGIGAERIARSAERYLARAASLFSPDELRRRGSSPRDGTLSPISFGFVLLSATQCRGRSCDLDHAVHLERNVSVVASKRRRSIMPTICDLIYREYCRARLAEMRKQLYLIPGSAVVEADCDVRDLGGSDDSSDDDRTATQQEARGIH
jgi:hypothetical protein